jgi:CubicO group peptidase (beta-lactamase class C family)
MKMHTIRYKEKAFEPKNLVRSKYIMRTLFWVLGLVGIVLIAVFVFKITGNNTSQFTGPVSPGEPLPAALISDLEKYVEITMRENDVPGVSMVLVQGNQIVYANGMGVRDLQTEEPVTTETLMGIGSATKTMTAVMVGGLVDDGIIDWDTPVTDLLPSFSLSDPEITAATTLQHTLCMCTGVPRRMEEISFRYSELSPEDMIESLATIPLNGKFERKFNYSSRMLAAGGYIASMAVGGEYGDLAHSYARVMQERLFDPLEMTSSTFSVQEAVASGNYATPHYSSLSGFEATPPELEGVFMPIAGAGALWSSADDMGKYLLMLLNNGVANNGKRVISPDTLAHLWEPRVYIDADNDYGLGWHVEDYHGLTVLFHPGGTVGFAAELVVIPELNVGFALMANRMDMVAMLGRMTTYRLLEMLTGSEQVYHEEIAETKREVNGQIRTLSLATKKTVAPDKIEPFLGVYHNEVLGDVELELHEDNTLWVDQGEYDIPLRPLRLEKDQYIVYSSIFIGKTLTLGMGFDGHPTMTLTGDETTYKFMSALVP